MHMAAFSYQQTLPFSLDFASFPSVPPFKLPPLSMQQAEDLAGVSSCLPFYDDPLVGNSIIPVEIPPLVAAISPMTSNTTTTPTLERSSSLETGRTLLSGDHKITSSSSPRRGQVASKARCSSEKKRKERQRNNPLSAKDANGVKSRKLKSCREATKDAGEKKGPQEAPTGYIHVRARRGQATDSHSLAERVRRERIRERMKVLQGLVPGCEKVVGKALLLDEIINYVQSLQIQVEFLSMKLASMNPMLHDFGSDFDGYMSLYEKLESISPALTNVQRTSHTQPTAFADTANYTVEDPSVPLLLHGEGPIFSFPQDDGSNFVMQVEVGNDGQCFLSQAELKTISSFQ